MKFTVMLIYWQKLQQISVKVKIHAALPADDTGGTRALHCG